jgi:hypothetical protein
VAGGGGARRSGRNRAAIERTIAAMRRADRLLEVDAATLARTTAIALDAAAGAYDVAVLGRVHLAAVQTLLGGRQAPPSDDVDRFFAGLRAAAVRDTQDT